MTPKALTALNDLITEDREWAKLHHTHKISLVDDGYVVDGVATEAGLLASDIPTHDMTVMILGKDVPYGKMVLAKGTEVVITWRGKAKGQKHYYPDLVDGVVSIKGGKTTEVRMYIPIHAIWEKRIMPILDRTGIMGV